MTITIEEASAALRDVRVNLDTEENRRALTSVDRHHIEDVAWAFLFLTQYNILDDLNRQALVVCQGNSQTLARGLANLNEAGILNDENRTLLRDNPNDSGLLGAGLSCLQRSGLLDPFTRATFLDFGENVGWFSNALYFLFENNLLTRDTFDFYVVNDYHTLHMLFGNLRYARPNNILTTENFARVRANIQHLTELREGIQKLLSAEVLNQESFNVLMVSPANASREADRIIAPRRAIVAFASSIDALAPHSNAILAMADNVVNFYALPPSEEAGFDLPHLADGIPGMSHTGPQIRRMAYVYSLIQENNLIPNTPDSIRETIDRIVAYANSLDDASFDGALPDQSRRMFKLGVDRLLRINERVTQIKDWNSRALVLGLFRYIEEYQIAHSDDRDGLQRLRLAFITGVRHVIESERDDVPCHDPVCISAATRGFFASEDPADEIRNLEGIHPKCHGRLRNLSVEISGILGYPTTFGLELIQLLSNLSNEQHIKLVEKLDHVDVDVLEPNTMTITADDVDLYSAGIDSTILGNLIQLRTPDAGIPEGVTEENGICIRELLVPRPSRLASPRA